MGSKSDTVFPGWSWSLINFPISFVPLILASSMLSAAFSLAIIPVEIEASAILLNGGNENICKDIHNSLNSVFIFSFAGRVQITVAMSLLIVAQVLMQAFQNICSIRSSDFSSFYCTNLSWKSSSATRCFRVLVDCHSITLSVSLLLKLLVLVSCTAKSPSEKRWYTSGKSFSSASISPRKFLR